MLSPSRFVPLADSDGMADVELNAIVAVDADHEEEQKELQPRRREVLCRFSVRLGEPHAAAHRCCRASRLAAFPRLARLSDEEFSEVQFAVLLRSLPKDILAYKFLAPDTDEWTQDGRREAGLIGQSPMNVPALSEVTLKGAAPGDMRLWLVGVCVLCLFVAMLTWTLRTDTFFQLGSTRLFLPPPLNGTAIDLFDDPSDHFKVPGLWLVFLTTPILCLLFSTAVGLFQIGQYAAARWRYQRLIDERRRQRMVFYRRMLPAQAAWPEGELEFDSAALDERAREAFVSVRTTAALFLSFQKHKPGRCFGHMASDMRQIILGILFGFGLASIIVFADVVHEFGAPFTCPMRLWIPTDLGQLNGMEWATVRDCS